MLFFAADLVGLIRRNRGHPPTSHWPRDENPTLSGGGARGGPYGLVGHIPVVRATARAGLHCTRDQEIFVRHLLCTSMGLPRGSLHHGVTPTLSSATAKIFIRL